MRTVILALDDSQSLDILGPAEVFDAASRIAARDDRSAQALLEDGQGVDAAARAAGFASAEVLRRTFHRRLGVGPAAYRERFRAAA